MTIRVGSTEKIAVMNDPSDPSSPILTAAWHTPIVRVGSNAKLNQPNVSGIGIRWNMARSVMNINHRTGAWTGSVIKEFNSSLDSSDVSPAGAISASKKTYSSSAYPWASEIGTVNGQSGVTPDYVRLPSTIRNYTGSSLTVEMYVTSTSGSAQYNVMTLSTFGVAVLISNLFSTTGNWYRYPVPGTIVREFGDTGFYTGSVSKGTVTFPIGSTSTYVFIVPFVSDIASSFSYNGVEYVTDIMLGIKLTT